MGRAGWPCAGQPSRGTSQNPADEMETSSSHHSKVFRSSLSQGLFLEVCSLCCSIVQGEDLEYTGPTIISSSPDEEGLSVMPSEQSVLHLMVTVVLFLLLLHSKCVLHTELGARGDINPSSDFQLTGSEGKEPSYLLMGYAHV